MFLKNWAHLYSNPTQAEIALEPAVAATGKRYRFQHPFWRFGFIVDFALMDDMTIVEVDGASHLTHDQKVKDLVRAAALKQQGWRTVRIWNEDALRDPAGALSRALRAPEESYNDITDQLYQIIEPADVAKFPKLATKLGLVLTSAHLKPPPKPRRTKASRSRPQSQDE